MDNCTFKICIKCNEVKADTDFPYFSTKGAGRKNSCKICNSKLVKVRNELKKDNFKPKCNTCIICQRTDRKLVLDHNHETNEFRGWLCDGCNSALGKFDDDIQKLQRAIAYLKGENKHQDEQE